MKGGWAASAMGEVAEINPKADRPADDTPVSFVPMTALNADVGQTLAAETRRFSAVAKGYSQFRRDDLLVAKITPCFENGKIGRAAIQHELGAGSTEFHVVRPDTAKLDPSYALHFLRLARVRRAGELRMTGSAGQRRVPEQFLAALSIPLPPLDEQRRVARVLDAADALRARRLEAIETLDALRVSLENVLEEQATGSHALGELLDRIDSGKSPVCEDRPAADGEWGVLKLGAVSSGVYRPEQNKAILPGTGPSPESEVQAGDVLMARKNTLELVGASAYVWDTPPRLLLPDLIFRLVPRSDAGIRPLYLQAALTRPRVRAAVRRLAGGSAGSMPNISKGRLRTVEVTVPPLATQEQFERHVSRVARARKLSTAQLRHLDALFASLQHRAFTGTL